MRSLVHWLSLALIAFSLSYCAPAGEGTTENVPGVTDTTIVLGTWGPLTGPAALWGSIPMGMDAYFKKINEEGGINGRKIRLIVKDDAYDPSRTVPAVREMVQKDNVFAFVGGVGTAPGIAVMDYIVENDIPWISPITGSHEWAFPPKRNIFSIFPLYYDEAQVQVDYAVDSLGLSKVAIIYQNDDLGKSALIAAQEALAAHDLELVGSVSVEVTDSDLTSHAARLQQSGAEIVLLWLTPRQAAIIIGTTQVMGYQPEWFGSTLLSDMSLMHNITKGAWEGVVFPFFGAMPYDTTDQTVQEYQQILAKYQPEVRWGSFAYAGMVFAEPMAEALRLAGKDLTREKLIEVLENMDNFQSSGPVISFGPDKRQGLRSIYLIRCKGATDYEILTEYITSDADVDVLIEKLQEM